MIDYGMRKTDLAVKRTEWRLSRVYHQAAQDIEEKMKAWQKGHEAREARYRQQLAEGKITKADFDAWMRGQVFQGKQWQARKAEIETILYNAEKVAANIVTNGKLGVFAENYNYITTDIAEDKQIKSGFTMYDENTVARLIKSDPQMLPKPAEGVQKDKAYTYYNKLINQSVTLGIIQGESIPEIAKRIARTTGERCYNSAVRNARTAYTAAQNAGRIEGLHQAQKLGIEVQKKWIATNDSRTRDAHRELDGQIRDVDEPFDSELGKIRFPGDPTAAGANVYNCRCTLVYVYPDYESEQNEKPQPDDGQNDESGQNKVSENEAYLRQAVIEVRAGGHVSNTTIDRIFAGKVQREDIITRDAGVSIDKAAEYVDVVQAYAGNEYDAIRKLQAGKIKDPDVIAAVEPHEVALEDFIDKSTKWSGGRTYRAIGLTDDGLNDIISDVDKTKDLSMLGTSSWTTDKDYALTHTIRNDNRVVFVCETQKNGVSIMAHSLSPYEYEVLVSKKSRYKPIKMENISGVVYVYVEESE